MKAGELAVVTQARAGVEDAIAAVETERAVFLERQAARARYRDLVKRSHASLAGIKTDLAAANTLIANLSTALGNAKKESAAEVGHNVLVRACVRAFVLFFVFVRAS